MSTVRTMYPKKTFSGFLSFLDRAKAFYLRYTIIHVTLLANTPRKVKDAKIAQFLLLFVLTLLRRGFLPSTGPGMGL